MNTQEKLNFKLEQVFGDEATMDTVADEDVISAISFDHSGQYIALGDKSGRLIIFEKGEDGGDYQYSNELQSHTKEFDYLKSVDIDDKINHLQWMKSQGKNNHFILTTNDKTVKLWKVYSAPKKEFRPANKNAKGEKDLEMPKIKATAGKSWQHMCKRSFANHHNYHINSISICANGENFISSDDLRINLWNIENRADAFNIIDLKPANFEELSEVITASQFHPIMDNQFVFSTSKGVIRVGDLRTASTCDQSAINFEDKESNVTKNFFTDIISSISDVTFSKNGKYLFSRDFLSVKIWDLAQPKRPVDVINIFEPLKSKLCELYENESIFDKFSISSSPCSNYFMTGLFNNNFHISDVVGQNNMQFELNFDKKTVSKHIPKKFYEPLGPTYNFNRKALRSCWHPTDNTVAVACLNSLFFYTANKV